MGQMALGLCSSKLDATNSDCDSQSSSVGQTVAEIERCVVVKHIGKSYVIQFLRVTQFYHRTGNWMRLAFSESSVIYSILPGIGTDVNDSQN
jgi:hypothetical protein